LVCATVAAALGAALGGVFLSRLGRVVFVAALGYVANGLWHRDGRLDAGRVLDRLLGREERTAPPDGYGAAAPAPVRESER
jgi:hypothetical protein